jgi:hypothetical protein
MEPITNVHSAHYRTLQKALSIRGIIPGKNRLEMRAQAEEHNSHISTCNENEVAPLARSAAVANLTPLFSAPVDSATTTAPPARTPIVSPHSTRERTAPLNINFTSWPVLPFTGSEDVREFFTRLEEIARSRRFPFDLLPSVLPEFLKGRALTYYRAYCSSTSDWPSLKILLLQRFEEDDYLISKKLEIWSSRQTSQELSADYIARVININRDYCPNSRPF